MNVDIRIGDVRAELAKIESDSIDCIVTSPPYWGLRDYGIAGQLGLESTLGEHIEAIVAVCEELRRVLKPTGTFWLNYGDCYATTPNGRSAADTKAAGNDDRTFRDKPFSTIGGVLKPKDLCMVPNRIAIALQEAGWWVRSEIIWAKPNPMPESVTDRPATSHEKVFLLTKSARYFYDAEAVRVPLADTSVARMQQDIDNQEGSARAHAGAKTNGNIKPRRIPSGWASSENYKNQDPRYAKRDKQRGHGKRHAGFNDRWDQMSREEQQQFGRNLRNVWTIATKPFSEAHFATFPPDLVEPCIKAGCPKGGLVLDPFGGAGTTGLVADRLQRDCILIELNPEYAEIARRRIERDRGELLAAMEAAE